jgi:hypothetical protein
MEDYMQAYTHATSSWWVSTNIRRHAKSARSGCLVALLRRIAKRFPRNEDIIADCYSGCSWGDETERRLLDGVFNGQRGSSFN